MGTISYRYRTWAMFLLLLIGIGWTASIYADDGQEEDFVFIGDSLSDSGNRFFYEGTLNTPPYSTLPAQNMIPTAPYAIGGPTFSNGKVFPEYVARALGVGGLAKPAARTNGIAANYAYAGARAANLKAPNSNRNLDQQVADYIADGVKTGAIHVVEIGGNDIGVALQAAATGFPPVDPVGVIVDAIQSMFVQMLTLEAFEADRFLIVTAANSGLIPVFGGDSGAITFGYLLTSFYNCGIVGDGPGRPCAALPITWPGSTVKDALEAEGAEVLVFEGQALFDSLYFNPEAFGLTNVTDACVMPNVPPYRCANPDEYLFWDGTHPTKKTHQLIGEAIVAFLSQ